MRFDELQAALDANPFPEAAGNRLLISFLNEVLPAEPADFGPDKIFRGDVPAAAAEIFAAHSAAGTT